MAKLPPRPQPPPKPATGGAAAAPGGELQAWIESLERQQKSLGRRNRLLGVFFATGLIALAGLLAYLYQMSVRSYAALDQVSITRSPVNQSKVQIAFNVIQPGKVYLRRRSGDTVTEVVDYFSQSGAQSRSWSWIYEPGTPIDVELVYRGSIWRRKASQQFPTANSADIVILMDTTGSMSRSIATLKDKCVEFSRSLHEQQLEHRFALIGFGDTQERQWCDTHQFTADVAQFREYVGAVQRFDGGDLPESSLEAIAEALKLPLAEESMRRFYLVTDAAFHEATPTAAAEIAKQLLNERVLLSVFTQAEFQDDYARITDPENIQSIEDFGQVLSDGRILED